MNRREFLVAGSALAAATVPQIGSAAEPAGKKSAATGKLILSPPVLQNAAETSMGVGFAVSDMANGYVDYATTPDFRDAVRVKCGGYRVTGMDDHVMLVRLTGLKGATTYYYRIGADRISYGGGYKMKIVGHEEDPATYCFRTLGAGGASSFCVINDTHAQMRPFGLALDKVAALAPACAVWNGDACNTQETVESLVNIFYTPDVARRDYAAQRPWLFVPGNHDFRGLAARHLERVMMFRQPEERLARDWDLGRNFAVRCGDIAMIGLDTGEDKLDGRDVFAGLFNMEPYRVAQRAWLSDALARPEIRSAPHLVAFCHIPLFDANPRANPGDCDKDGNGRYSEDFAIWQRTCAKLWGPLLDAAGCQLVIAAHCHRYRYDPPADGRRWAQIVGGGPECGVRTQWLADGTRKATRDDGRFPTVIAGEVAGGVLRVTVHDVLNDRIAGQYTFAPRA